MVLPKRAGEFGMKIVVNRIQEQSILILIIVVYMQKKLRYLCISKKSCTFAA